MTGPEWFFDRCGIKPSDFQKRAAAFLDTYYCGFHHCPLSFEGKFKKAFSNKWWVELLIGESLATYDFDRMTRLVFLAHDYCLRVEIKPCNFRYMRMIIHDRAREGRMSERHPTLEQAVDAHRGSNAFVYRAPAGDESEG